VFEGKRIQDILALVTMMRHQQSLKNPQILGHQKPKHLFVILFFLFF